MTSNAPSSTGASGWTDTEVMEPRLYELLLDKRERAKLGPYRPRGAADVTESLKALLAGSGVPGAPVNVRRMSGGASKEQFVFEIDDGSDAVRERMVLRMDPREGIIETCRRREAQVLNAVHGIVPVPPVRFVDGDGRYMGQPAMVTGFVGGVAKPSAGATGPSGVGSFLGPRIGAALAPQYIGNLAAVHAHDFRNAGLDDYAQPRPGTTDAALWQVNYWSMVRRIDGMDCSPMLMLIESWLRARLPVCEEPLLLHGDYRLGNFLYDEESLQMTAVLDWELCHIGDYHEDLAYNLDPLFSSRNDKGELVVATMFTEREFLDRYTAVTGRTVDPDILLWYRVLTSFKLIAMNHASSPRAVLNGTNHQNALLGFLSAVTAGLSETACRLMSGEDA